MSLTVCHVASVSTPVSAYVHTCMHTCAHTSEQTCVCVVECVHVRCACGMEYIHGTQTPQGMAGLDCLVRPGRWAPCWLERRVGAHPLPILGICTVSAWLAVACVREGLVTH